MIQFDERAYFSDGLVKNHQLETTNVRSKKFLGKSFWDLMNMKVLIFEHLTPKIGVKDDLNRNFDLHISQGCN